MITKQQEAATERMARDFSTLLRHAHTSKLTFAVVLAGVMIGFRDEMKYMGWSDAEIRDYFVDCLNDVMQYPLEED